MRLMCVDAHEFVSQLAAGHRYRVFDVNPAAKELLVVDRFEDTVWLPWSCFDSSFIQQLSTSSIETLRYRLKRNRIADMKHDLVGRTAAVRVSVLGRFYHDCEARGWQPERTSPVSPLEVLSAARRFHLEHSAYVHARWSRLVRISRWLDSARVETVTHHQLNRFRALRERILTETYFPRKEDQEAIRRCRRKSRMQPVKAPNELAISDAEETADERLYRCRANDGYEDQLTVGQYYYFWGWDVARRIVHVKDDYRDISVVPMELFDFDAREHIPLFFCPDYDV